MTSAEPSNDWPSIVRAVASLVAVPAFPETVVTDAFRFAPVIFFDAPADATTISSVSPREVVAVRALIFESANVAALDDRRLDQPGLVPLHRDSLRRLRSFHHGHLGRRDVHGDRELLRDQRLE